MKITFDDNANDALARMVREAGGYMVAILSEGQALPPNGDVMLGVDVILMGADAEGVTYDQPNSYGEATGVVETRSWDTIDRIHIY